MGKSILRDIGFTEVFTEILPKKKKIITGLTEATEITTCACSRGEADATSQLSKENAGARHESS